MAVSLMKLEVQLTRIETGVAVAMKGFHEQIADMRRLVGLLKSQTEHPTQLVREWAEAKVDTTLNRHLANPDFRKLYAEELAKANYGEARAERDDAIAQMNIAIASEQDARAALADSVPVARVREALNEAYDRTANVGLAVKLVAAMLGIDLDEPDDGQE